MKLMINITMSETIEVLYNTCYGGFSPSDIAIDLYKTRTGVDYDRYDFPRHDPVMVQIFHELGKKFNGFCSDIRSEIINAKYKDFYEIAEYDGCESVNIPIEKFMLSEITKIANSKICSDDKITEIKKILDDKN